MKLLKFGYRLSRIFIYLVTEGSFNPKIKNLKTTNATCYVLGNGPSLIKKIEESTFLQNQENLIVVNNFVLTEHYQVLKPNYYMFYDPSYWDEKNSELYLKCQNVLKKIANETTWNLNIVAPKSAVTIFKKHFSKNKNINLNFVNGHSLNPYYKRISYFLYSRNYTLPHCQNVLVFTTYLALNIGFKEINLLGAEHSWLESLKVNEENQVCLKDKHFYNTEAKLKPWLNIVGDVYRMDEILVDLAKMFSGYHTIADYAKFKKAVIYNCTKNSFIDAFKRKKI
jgi:hypothetical protein